MIPTPTAQERENSPRQPYENGFRCPSAGQLRAFALGRLEAETLHRLFEHLRHCQICGRDLIAYCSFFPLKEAQLRAGDRS